MKEQPRHKRAFEYYVSLEEKRSLSQVGKEFKVSDQTMTKWNREFHWQERVQKRDKKNAKALAKKTDTEIVKRDARNIKIAEGAIKVFAQSLIGHVEHICECGVVSQIPIPKAKITADQFDKMVRLVGHIMGEEQVSIGTIINVNLLPCDPVPRAKAVESEVIDG